MLFIDAQIEKCEKKLKNLIDIYTDAQISKEEFQSMRTTYDGELKKLKEQKEKFGQQQEIVEKCILDMSAISKALGDMVDMSEPKLTNEFLDEVVSSIVPTNRKYTWNFRVGGNINRSVDYIVDGNKNCPNIHLDCDDSSEDSDEASDIHKISLLPVAKAFPEKLSLMSNLHTPMKVRLKHWR